MFKALLMLSLITSCSFGVEYGQNETAVKSIIKKFGNPDKVMFSVNGDGFDPSIPGMYGDTGDASKLIMLVYKISSDKSLCIEIEKGEYVRTEISEVNKLFDKK